MEVVALTVREVSCEGHIARLTKRQPPPCYVTNILFIYMLFTNLIIVFIGQRMYEHSEGHGESSLVSRRETACMRIEPAHDDGLHIYISVFLSCVVHVQ